MLSMLSRLPNDIISELFDILAVLDPPRRWHDCPHEPWRKLGWVKLTHICRRFREIGLGRSTLWGDIVTIFPSAFDTLLGRSRIAPLSLDLGRTIFQNQTFNSTLPSYLERVKNISDSDWSTIISSWRGSERAKLHPRKEWEDLLAGRTLPWLQSIRLIGWRDIKSSQLVCTKNPFIAPALHTYRLERFIPFSAPRLRVLSLNDPRMKCSDYLVLLESCPLLVSLHIHGGLWSNLAERDAIKRRVAWMEQPALETALTDLVNCSRLRSVAMKHIRKIWLKGGFDTYLLLHHLSMPANVTLRITLYDRVARFPVLAPLIITQLRRPTRDVLIIDGIPDASRRASSRTYIALEESGKDWKWPYSARGVTLELEPTRSAPVYPTPPQLDCLPSDVMYRIRTFVLKGCSAMSPHERPSSEEERGKWRTLLGRFPGVTKLYIRQDTYPIFDVLKEHPPTSSNPVFPNLHTVVVHFEDFVGPPSTRWWGELLALFGVRKAMHWPVMRVVLTGRLCHLVDGKNDMLGDGTGDESVEPGLKLKELQPEDLKGLVQDVLDERGFAPGGCDCATRGKLLREARRAGSNNGA